MGRSLEKDLAEALMRIALRTRVRLSDMQAANDPGTHPSTGSGRRARVAQRQHNPVTPWQMQWPCQSGPAQLTNSHQD